MNFLRRRNMMSGAFWTCAAMSAKPLEPVDVVAERPSARARRLRGALPRARTPLQVCTPRFGGYARAAARQGAFAVEFRELNGVFGAFAVLNAFGVPPGGARRAMHSEGGGRREATTKTAQERARRPRRRARDGDAVGEVLKLSPAGGIRRKARVSKRRVVPWSRWCATA